MQGNSTVPYLVCLLYILNELVMCIYWVSSLNPLSKVSTANTHFSAGSVPYSYTPAKLTAEGVFRILVLSESHLLSVLH